MFEILAVLFFVISIFLGVRAYKLASMVLSLTSLVTIDNKNADEEMDVLQEQFLKFVSDSRDWAFDYIENAQDTLISFNESISTLLDSYTKEEIHLDPAKILLKEIQSGILDLLPDRNS